MNILTKEDEDFITNNINTYNTKELTERLNEMHNTDVYKTQIVSSWIYNSGLKKRRKNAYGVFKPSDIEFIKNNYDKMTYREIAETLNLSETQVRGKALHMGFKKNRRFNNRYFENIDTPLKAYLLGYIYADGWISSNGTSVEFGMELQTGDRYILEKLNEELGNQHVINDLPAEKQLICGCLCNIQEHSVLRIYSKPFVNDLISQGISFNKTYSGIYPTVEDRYFFDYLRGYIDGDGSIYTDYVHNHKDAYIQIRIACHCKENLEYIRDRLLQFDIKTNVYKSTDSKYDLICYTTEDVEKLANKLYYSPDVFCLSRKRNKILSLINYGSVA